jgi:hypothetical protein
MGGRRIYLRLADGTLRAMTEAPFAKEDLLQGLLEKYPALLAGDQMNGTESRKWLLVARELGIPSDEAAVDRWSLDHLFLDQDGIPTLVEVKRSTDTRIRREVVGQMLDYAANAVLYWPPEMLRARFEAGCEARHEDCGDVVTRFVGNESSGADPVEYFWEQVKTNLQAGRIRLIFVADQVPPELRRIVEFLNGQMDPAEVLAVEVRQFVGDDLQTLVPQIVGQTAASEQKKGGSRSYGTWDAPAFLQSATEKWKLTQDQLQAVARLLEFSSEQSDDCGWGAGKVHGSFNPKFLKVSPRSLYTVQDDGYLVINFAWLDANLRERLADDLKTIPLFAAKIKQADGYPKFTVDEWRSEVDKFIDIINKVVA